MTFIVIGEIPIVGGILDSEWMVQRGGKMGSIRFEVRRDVKSRDKEGYG